MEHILLKMVLRGTPNKEVFNDGQCGFTKSKSCMTNLVAFCSGVKALVNEGRKTDVINLKLCQIFDAVLVSIQLVSKVERDRSDEPNHSVDKSCCHWLDVQVKTSHLMFLTAC